MLSCLKWKLTALIAVSFIIFKLDLKAQSDTLSKGVFFETSIERSFYSVSNTNNLFQAPLVPISVNTLGYWIKAKKYLHSIGYVYFNFRQGYPQWQNPLVSIPKKYTGPNYIHGLNYHIKRGVLSPSEFFSIAIDGGVSLCYIAANKDDLNSIPIDSVGIGRLNIYNSDSTEILRLVEYSRFTSDILFALQLSVNLDFRLCRKCVVSVMPTYSQGLLTINKTDFWYQDFYKNQNGSGKMYSRGSSVGIKFRFSYAL